MRSSGPRSESDNRPPVAITPARLRGTGGRPSVWRRSTVAPLLWEDGTPGFPPSHPYVRRFWTAALGPGAVADLLRLIVAARRGRPLPHPEYLHALARAGLILHSSEKVWVRSLVPPLGAAQLRSVSPALRAEHARAVADFFDEDEKSA